MVNYQIREIEADELVSLIKLETLSKKILKASLLLDRGVKESAEGFLVAPKTAQEYALYMQEGGRLLIAESVPSQTVIGFLGFENGRLFHEHHPLTEAQWDFSKVDGEFVHAYVRGDFVYLNQLGVSSEFSKVGVGRALVSRFEELNPGVRKILAVLKEPVYNTGSTLFFEKLGYSEVGLFLTEKLHDLDSAKGIVMKK